MSAISDQVQEYSNGKISSDDLTNFLVGFDYATPGHITNAPKDPFALEMFLEEYTYDETDTWDEVCMLFNQGRVPREIFHSVQEAVYSSKTAVVPIYGLTSEQTEYVTDKLAVLVATHAGILRQPDGKLIYTLACRTCQRLDKNSDRFIVVGGSGKSPGVVLSSRLVAEMATVLGSAIMQTLQTGEFPIEAMEQIGIVIEPRIKPVELLAAGGAITNA